jgi:hypothetical protein
MPSVFTAACASLTFLVFLAHFFANVLGEEWCHSHCFGPYLSWNKGDHFFDDSNVRFRATFSLMPKPLGENFGPLFLSLLTWFKLDAIVQQDKYRVPTTLYLLAVCFWGCFPYAGGAGIVCGFLLLVLLALVLFLPWVKDKDLPLPSVNLPTLGTFSSRTAKVLVYGCLALVALNNLVHIVHNEMQTFCHDEHDNCIGPGLKWPDHFFRDVNLPLGTWGHLFSLDLNRVLDCWTPLFLVLVTYLAQPLEHAPVGWFLVLALFGSFGYSGNGGIVAGLILCLMSFINVFCVLPMPSDDEGGSLLG